MPGFDRSPHICGVFICITSVKLGQWNPFIYTIFSATHPKCRISSTEVSESDVVTMSCSVVYKGHLAPLMKWKTTKGLTITSTVNSIQFGSAIRLTYTASVIATPDLNGIQFQCTTYFDRQNSNLNLPANAMCNCDRKSSVPSSDSNVPTYSYSWTSSALSISGKSRIYYRFSQYLIHVKR